MVYFWPMYGCAWTIDKHSWSIIRIIRYPYLFQNPYITDGTRLDKNDLWVCIDYA